MAKQAIPRLYDFELVETLIFEALKDRDIDTHTGISHALITIADKFSFSIFRDDFDKSIEQNREAIEIIKNAKSYSINRITIISNDDRLRIIYERTEDRFTDLFFLDNRVNHNPITVTPIDIKAFTTISETLLKRSARQPNESDPEQLKAHYETLSQLQKLTTDVAQSQIEYRARVDEEKESYLKLTQQELKNKLEELSQEYKQRSEALSEKYIAAEQKLIEREKAVNDADNTTTRRRTTEEVLNNTKAKAESFNFSRSVRSGRQVVLILSWLLLTFGLINIGLGTLGLSQISTIQVPDPSAIGKSSLSIDKTYAFQWWPIWINIAKLVSGTFLLISSVVYLIRWQNQWTNKIANIELDYQKFSRDLNRAHVTIEMCLEWNDKKDGKIPETLLSAMTDGLFKENNAQTEEILHPAEQLAAAMLKTADRIEFPLGNGSVTTNGKKLSKAKGD